MFCLGVFLFSAILFFVLVPGILVSLPSKGNKYVVAAVHALIFALIWHCSHTAVWHLTEGFEIKQPMAKPTMHMQPNMPMSTMNMQPTMPMQTMNMANMGMQPTMNMQPTMPMQTMNMTNMGMQPTMDMQPTMPMPTMNMANMGMQPTMGNLSMNMQPTMGNLSISSQSYE